MADVALATGRLVGDHAERIRLGAGAGGRRDGDEGTTGGQRRAVVVELPDGQRVVGGPEVERLGGVHRGAATDRHDDRALQAEGESAAAPRSTVEAAGFGSTSSNTAVSRPALGQHGEDAIDDAGAADARIGHDEDPRATGRGDQLGESRDRADPEVHPVAQHDLDLAIGEAGHVSDLDDLVDRWCRAGRSASAGSRPRGTSARS